jgi:hypothetical protein
MPGFSQISISVGGARPKAHAKFPSVTDRHSEGSGESRISKTLRSFIQFRMTEKPFLQESLSAITIITDVIVWYRQSMPSPLVNLRLILLKASEAETLSESVPRCPRRTFLQAGKGTNIKAHPGFTF